MSTSDDPHALIAIFASLKSNETGGLLAAVSERPGGRQIASRSRPHGPLADWRGRLALGAQALASLETDLEFGLAGLPRIGLTAAWTWRRACCLPVRGLGHFEH
jgi:hypothetical protein